MRVSLSPFVLLALHTLTGLAGAQDSPARPPNILFLFADDLRPDMVGAFGSRDVHTPTLDSLAARGVCLHSVSCMGSPHGAVCVPSRAMVMSGRYLTRVRTDLKGAVTLPELLRQRGYSTFMTGKWHNGDAALRRAFPDARAVLRGGMSNHFAMDLCDVDDGEIGNQGFRNGHSSDLFTAAAVDFLRQHDAAVPFFAYVAFTAPHDPRDPPRRWLEQLKRELPPPALPVNFRGQHGLDLGKATMTVRDENLLGWPRDEDLLREQLAEYRALVTHLDEQIGRILAVLDERGLTESTLVVFAADHGLALGSHGLLGKQSLYEHSMRAPVIFAGPGIPRGEHRRGLAYLLDLMPTMARAGGATLPAEVDGRDLLPLVRGEGEGRDALVTIYADSQRAIRAGRHKLIRLPQIDRTLLFDLTADKHEMFDLAPDANYAAVRTKLEQRLQAELRELGDRLPWTAEEVLPAQIDLTGHRGKPDRHQPDWIVEKYWPRKFWRRKS